MSFFVRYIRDVKADESLHLSKAIGPFDTAIEAKNVAIAHLQSLMSWGVMVCESPGARWKDALWTGALRFQQEAGDPEEAAPEASPHKNDPLAGEILYRAELAGWPLLSWENTDGEVYMKIGGDEAAWLRFADKSLNDTNLLKLALLRLDSDTE